MFYWRNPFWVKMTLFFFTIMLLYHPAYAGAELPNVTAMPINFAQYGLPVAYVSEAQAQQLVGDYQRRGYVVKQGSVEQLEKLMLAGNQESAAAHEIAQTGEQQESEEQKKPDCEKPGKSRQAADGSANQAGVEKEQNNNDSKPVNKLNGGGALDEKKHRGVKQKKTTDCEQSNPSADAQQQSSQQAGAAQPVPDPGVETVPVPPPPAEPMPEPIPSQQSTMHTSVGVHADASYGGRGSSNDFAKVFFILIGVVVVAAFVVYAGKYITDMVKGKDFKLWWELIFNNTFLGTDSGQHGRFAGAKIATGFVSSDLIQVALVGEVGNMDLNLLLNEDVNPMELDISGNYWMLGATARLHLTDKLVNASYLYLEFMGGSTDHKETDLIGAARLGASFGINDFVRLGASFGAQYIGLDEDQGFVNDDDNYWVTYGIEMGVRF